MSGLCIINWEREDHYETKIQFFQVLLVLGLIICLGLIITGNVSAVEFDGGTGEPNDPSRMLYIAHSVECACLFYV